MGSDDNGLGLNRLFKTENEIVSSAYSNCSLPSFAGRCDLYPAVECRTDCMLAPAIEAQTAVTYCYDDSVVKSFNPVMDNSRRLGLRTVRR